MIDEELLKSLDNKEKEKVLESLQNLIHQTYVVEQEYKELTLAYRGLQEIIKQIIECIPNAIWVLEKDGGIFLENSMANHLGHIFPLIDISKREDEIEFDNNFYLIRINSESDKIVISATDITEERRKERLISMGQVAAHLAHEIRNPVGSVALLTSTLLKRVDLKTKPIVFEIKKSIWRVERIVKATLLFSKGLTLNCHAYSLQQLQEEIDIAVSYYTYSKPIEFEMEMPEKIIHADSDLLAIVFQNFVFNAIDAIEDEDNVEEGLIEIEYAEEEGYHVFRIYDNGIPIENKNLLFEPFKTTKTKGNGLGLALSMQIINAHEGSIRLIEEKKGFEIKIKV